ncbi:MAG: sugar ABC transporter permease, partial [Verrucomicrobiae bacterium]|nr:sugar ABC transporter permease [Verrucomicrobiae bacterium]
YGLLNYFLDGLGLPMLKRAWLADEKTALLAVTVIHMWRGFGWAFIILLAGLQSIPRELYEAAQVDGASAPQRFWRISFPLMIPVFILVSVLTILGSMQVFELIISTTGGGPGYHTEVPITRIVTAMLGLSDFGYACAMGIVFGVILLGVSLLQIRISQRLRGAD